MSAGSVSPFGKASRNGRRHVELDRRRGLGIRGTPVQLLGPFAHHPRHERPAVRLRNQTPRASRHLPQTLDRLCVHRSTNTKEIGTAEHEPPRLSSPLARGTAGVSRSPEQATRLLCQPTFDPHELAKAPDPRLATPCVRDSAPESWRLPTRCLASHATRAGVEDLLRL